MYIYIIIYNLNIYIYIWIKNHLLSITHLGYIWIMGSQPQIRFVGCNRSMHQPGAQEVPRAARSMAPALCLAFWRLSIYILFKKGWKITINNDSLSLPIYIMTINIYND